MAKFESVIPRTTARWKLTLQEAADEKTPEAALLDEVMRINNARAHRRAVHIHFSSLQRHNKKLPYLALAGDMFQSHVRTADGKLFTLGTGDLFFIVRHMSTEALVNAVDRLRLLFAEDPLAQYSESADKTFATYYDVEKNYEKLRGDVLALHKTADKTRRAKKAMAEKMPAPAHGRVFKPADLSKLITILERADLTNILRRQTACALEEGKPPQPLFKETFVSIDDLQQICTPDIDLLSDRWLFHYLSRTLDKRVLSLMVKDGIPDDIPFSLNLNIESLLSPEFRRFDGAVPESLRGRCMIEIHKVDVFSDIGAFIFARDFLHDRGYKLCLDGLTHHTLKFFDNNRLSLDAFKIYWAPEGLNAAHPASYPDIRKLITEYGAARVILCRCENEEALKVGRELGITRFQGRAIDALLLGARGRRR